MRENEYFWDAGLANPKQEQFFKSRALFTAYGGAKGGGKTWAIRTKALLGAYNYAGIRILIMRRTYRELQSNHIEPMLKMAVPELFSYNGSLHSMFFINGSIIHFGHWQGVLSENEYNGQEYDWIFIDEATQFSFRSFQFIGGMLRGANGFPKRMYLSCNPGGIGHNWVKRLFIDKIYYENPENPEESERPEDYLFIPATVEDNTALLKSSPGYLRLLSSMPEDLRRAYRYGDWEALKGSYFSEFKRERHCCEPFPIPKHWKRYRSFDYGLDMFALLWIAVDERGRAYVYRELRKKGLVAGQAARIAADMSKNEEIIMNIAPPDVRQTQKDSGRSLAELFAAEGMPLVFASNERVRGHLLIKEALNTEIEGKPALQVFSNLRGLIEDISSIEADAGNPSDCAREPHECTHSIDALRYFCSMRLIPAQKPAKRERGGEIEAAFTRDYENFLRGDTPTESYLQGF
jgi:phage terminase large subunit